MTLVNRGGRALLLLAWVGITGCDFLKQTFNISQKVTQPPATHATLLAEATGNYTYAAERAPVRVSDTKVPGPGGTLPSITIATASRISSTGRVPGNRFIGRLNSSAAYPRLQLAPGYNYVWRESSGATARFLIVPADMAYPMYFVKQEADNTPLDPGTSELPRLVQSALAYAMCDGGCRGGHCIMMEAVIAYAPPDDTTVIMAP